MAVLNFIGDISLNNEYNHFHEIGEMPFRNVSPILHKSDLVIGNLECLAAGDSGENHLKFPRLKTNIETLNYLSKINLNLALLANNHIFDNLESGLLKTIHFLKKNKISYIGAGFSSEEAYKPYIIEINQQKICILNYVSADTNPCSPPAIGIYVNWFDVNRVMDDIKKFKSQADFLVLTLHWGGKSEGGYYPEWQQIETAHLLIDEGADLIVGTHSHTLQPFEIYKNKYIYYSLGNFCFADIKFENFSFDTTSDKWTESIILKVNFNDNDYSVDSIPIKNHDLHVKVDDMVLKKYQKRLEYFRYLKKNRIFCKLYYVKFKLIEPINRLFFDRNISVREKLRKLSKERLKKYLRRLF